jgi:hypothetical protein
MKAQGNGVNPELRPKAYFGPRKLEEHLLSNVPGGVVRNRMREMFSAGQDREAQELIDEIENDGGEVASYLESIHPMFMGGNYLPERQPGEVEIGRINIKSTTYDVTSVYAGRANGKIRLRVVDEYGGDTLVGHPEMETEQPLTMGEFADFFLGVWPFIDVVMMNAEGDLDEGLDFFWAESSFYPDFDLLLRQRVIEAYAKAYDQRREEG